MSLTVTQRPFISDPDISKWNAVGNPVVYKMQRKDFTFNQINNNGGFIQLQFTGINLTASFVLTNSLYVASDNAVYDTFGLITASAFSAGNTLVTIDKAYISAAPGGFTNALTLRPSYKVEVEVYNSSNTLLTIDPMTYSASSRGAVLFNINTVLKANLSPDNEADFSSVFDVFTDTNVSFGFYIKYRETWTASAESQVSDSSNIFYSIYGAMQIPSEFGGNLYEYLMLSEMKKSVVNLTSAQVLTGNSVPVDVVPAPPTGFAIVPIMFFVYLDYNSVAYATNTTFRFEINGVAVSATNTTTLPGTADRFTTMLPIAYDTTTAMTAQALKFEVQTGNPTSGNSPIRVACIYTLQSIL